MNKFNLVKTGLSLFAGYAVEQFAKDIIVYNSDLRKGSKVVKVLGGCLFILVASDAAENYIDNTLTKGKKMFDEIMEVKDGSDDNQTEQPHVQGSAEAATAE